MKLFYPFVGIFEISTKELMNFTFFLKSKDDEMTLI